MKYRHDSLSRSELDTSRDKVAMMDDSELEQAIFDDWREADVAGSAVSPGLQTRLKRRIDIGLGLRPRPVVVAWRVIRIACVIMLPIFIAATAILYFREAAISPDMFTVSTNYGEQSTVMLPDSSVVCLNGNAKLMCCQSRFRGDERNIDFTGEAYFDIAKDAEHPFVINSRGLKITVLGTKFNLDARDNADCAVLCLDEGLVLLTSSLTGESVEVHPREKAVLTYSDGRIALGGVTPDDNIQAWRTGKLVFNDEPLSRVFEVMGRYYDYTLTVDDPGMLDMRFTGTIPSDDMVMAVAVLEKAFGTRFTMIHNHR